jgi:hypothetical protein
MSRPGILVIDGNRVAIREQQVLPYAQRRAARRP